MQLDNQSKRRDSLQAMVMAKGMDEKICNPLLLNGWKLISNVHACINFLKNGRAREVMLGEHWVKNEWKAWELMDGKIMMLFSFGPTFLGFSKESEF